MSLHRLLLTLVIICITLAAGVTIIQMWAPMFGWDVFIKLLATLGILTVVMGLILVLKADLGEHKKMKDENYLD